MNKIQSPAVFSGKEAVRKALSMKSFMNEKILSGQVQSKLNEELRQQKLEKEVKMKEERKKEDLRIAEKVAKDKKEQETLELTKLLGK